MTWEYSDFEREAINNLQMPNTLKRSVKMTNFVEPSKSKAPYTFFDRVISEYAYIVIPHVKGTSLINFLIKAKA